MRLYDADSLGRERPIGAGRRPLDELVNDLMELEAKSYRNEVHL